MVNTQENSGTFITQNLCHRTLSNKPWHANETLISFVFRVKVTEYYFRQLYSLCFKFSRTYKSVKLIVFISWHYYKKREGVS